MNINKNFMNSYKEAFLKKIEENLRKEEVFNSKDKADFYIIDVDRTYVHLFSFYGTYTIRLDLLNLRDKTTCDFVKQFNSKEKVNDFIDNQLFDIYQMLYQKVNKKEIDRLSKILADLEVVYGSISIPDGVNRCGLTSEIDSSENFLQAEEILNDGSGKLDSYLRFLIAVKIDFDVIHELVFNKIIDIYNKGN